MVKTRAQREQALVTPSPKVVEQVKRRKDTAKKRSDTTPNSSSGTVVGLTAKRKSAITNTPKARSRKETTQSSQNTNKLSKGRKQKSQDEHSGADIEDTCDENTDEGNLGDEQRVQDAGQQDAAVLGRRSSKKGRKGHIDHKEKEIEVQEPEDAAHDDGLMDEDEQEEKSEEKQEEDEDDEESENEDDNMSPEASFNQKRQTERVPKIDDHGAESDDDDDDAPQDVSFSTSRQEALNSISQALQQTKRTEERAREKRRNRDKLLKLQKERKKISLEDTRLPEDFLSEVAKIPDGQISETTPVAAPIQQRTNQHHKVFDSEDEMDFEENEDYIPLSSNEPHDVDGFAVHAISRQERAPPPKSDTALDFLQKQLYGGKIKRESVFKHKSKVLKRQGKPSLAFHNSIGKKKKHKILKKP